GAAAPGVGDEAGLVTRVRGAVRIDDPLHTAHDPLDGGAAAAGEDLAGDELHAGGHADLHAAAGAAADGAGAVRAVAVVVDGIGLVAAVEALPADDLAGEQRVVGVEAGVEDTHDHAGAVDTVGLASLEGLHGLEA